MICGKNDWIVNNLYNTKKLKPSKMLKLKLISRIKYITCSVLVKLIAFIFKMFN